MKIIYQWLISTFVFISKIDYNVIILKYVIAAIIVSVIIKIDFDKIVTVYIYTVCGHQLSWNKMYWLYKYL